jgi:hypothetical protein
VEEERLKSALELAMERLSGLPDLTPEEIAAQKEREFAPVGEALCRRYLAGLIVVHDIPATLGRYTGDPGRIVRRAFSTCLCDALRLEDASSMRSILEAVEPLVGAEICSEAEKAFRLIRDSYEQEKQNKSRVFERTARESMRIFGIAGSAVQPNLDADEIWQQELNNIRQTFAPSVEALRKNLLQKLLCQM